MGTPRSVVFPMTPLEAAVVEDALAYYSLVSTNNFDMGYSGYPDEREAHKRLRRVLERLTKQIEQ